MKRNGLGVNRSVPFVPTLGAAVLATLGGMFVEGPQQSHSLFGSQFNGSLAAIAQTLPPCAPPASDEHLVLVDQSTPEELEQLKTLLPDGSTTSICQYLDDTVIRVGGFANEEVATAWAEYLSTTLQVQTAIVRPATSFTLPDGNEESSPPDANDPEDEAAAVYPDYDPQLLGEGYAILVNYADRTDIAIAVQEELGESVGLAVYDQEPYLLALYSDDFKDSGKILRQLVDANFDALMVDSRQVILMTPVIAVTP